MWILRLGPEIFLDDGIYVLLGNVVLEDDVLTQFEAVIMDRTTFCSTISILALLRDIDDVVLLDVVFMGDTSTEPFPFLNREL